MFESTPSPGASWNRHVSNLIYAPFGCNNKTSLIDNPWDHQSHLAEHLDNSRSCALFSADLAGSWEPSFLWILQHHAQLPQSLHSPSQPDPTVTNNQDNVPDFTNGKSIAALSMKKHPSFPKCEAALLPWAGPECDPNIKHNEWCSGLESARGSGSIFYFGITKGRWPTKQLYREAGNLFKHLI